MKRILCITLVLLLVLMAFAACAPAPAPAPAADKPAAEAPKEDKPAEPAKIMELAFVPPSMESPFYAACIEGAKPVAENAGYKLTILSPEKMDDYAGQVSIVEDLVQRGVAGIAICAHDDKAIVTAVEKANAANIPVVIFNSLTDLPGGKVYAYTGYDQEMGGANVADWVNKMTNGNAVVAILEGLPGFHSTARKGGFETKLKDYPGIKVVASQTADWNREKGLNVAMNMVQANPDIKVFYGLNDEMALGASQAMKQAGKTDVLTVGIDGNPNALEAVKNGELTGSLYVNPNMIGAAAIEMLIKAIKGEPAPADSRVIIDTVVVDKSNVDQYLK